MTAPITADRIYETMHKTNILQVSTHFTGNIAIYHYFQARSTN